MFNDCNESNGDGKLFANDHDSHVVGVVVCSIYYEDLVIFNLNRFFGIFSDIIKLISQSEGI